MAYPSGGDDQIKDKKRDIVAYWQQKQEGRLFASSVKGGKRLKIHNTSQKKPSVSF
jgi:hypothetical protein